MLQDYEPSQLSENSSGVSKYLDVTPFCFGKSLRETEFSQSSIPGQPSPRQKRDAAIKRRVPATTELRGQCLEAKSKHHLDHAWVIRERLLGSVKCRRTNREQIRRC